MNRRLPIATSILLLLAFAAIPILGQEADRACTLDCWTTVPTVTVAEMDTHFLGFHNWWECPGAPTYIWDFGDGSPTNTAQFGWHRYTVPGTYTWTMTVNLEGTVCTRTGTIVADPPHAGCGFDSAALPTGLSILGSASRQQAGGVELTPDLADQVGAVWCMSMSQVYAGFETTFHFQVDHAPRRDTEGAEGFAFVLMYHGLQYTSFVGEGGSKMGYGGGYGTALEFDTSLNQDRNDPDGNHVSLMRTVPNVGLTGNHSDSLGTANPPFEIADGAVHEARILYEPGTYSVYLDGAVAPILQLPVDLAQINSFPGGNAIVGFTSSTSAEYESHRILDWTFTPAGPACILTCDAVAPSVANLGVPAYFSGSAGTTNCTGSPVYDWDFGDGSSHETIANPVHTYTAEGTFTWTMTVTIEDKTCITTGTILVRELCDITCTSSAPDTGVAGQPAAFQAQAFSLNCPDTPTFTWTFGDGATSAEQNPSHTYATAGTYTWTMTATIEMETCTGTGTIEIREPCTLSCTATVPATANAGQAVNFQAQATATNCTGPTTYSWAFGDGATSVDQNPSHAYTSAGTYSWALTVTAEGETCTQNGTVTVFGGIPGDCNGDGTVSIGEVQKAINMFLGIEPVGCGADCSGDGTVSIGEVQKVINAFLGLTTSC